MMYLYDGSELTGFLLKTITIYLDSFNHRIINPSVHLITSFINAFKFIQNRKVQPYVINDFVFILTIYIGTTLNLCY
jgi:hypothetical protein